MQESNTRLLVCDTHINNKGQTHITLKLLMGMSMDNMDVSGNNVCGCYKYYLRSENRMVFVNNLTLKLMIGVNVHEASINLSPSNI